MESLNVSVSAWVDLIISLICFSDPSGVSSHGWISTKNLFGLHSCSRDELGGNGVGLMARNMMAKRRPQRQEESAREDFDREKRNIHVRSAKEFAFEGKTSVADCLFLKPLNLPSKA